MIFSWENGRQLASMTKDNKTTSYTYDISGMRTQKNVDGTVTKYYYGDSNNLVSMVVGDRKLIFYYDQNGSISSVLDGSTRYYYVKNLQGDITMLVDENGSVAARYTYDHQGAVVSVLRGNGAPATDPYHIANLNPLRYRGYVYDTDSGLYYLQSRYYDPDTGRFINADVYCDTATGSPLSTNMFAYCENNSVNYIDYNGYFKYKNWYTYNPSTKRYFARSTLTIWGSNYIFIYAATKEGVIQFPFENNPYSSILWRGGGKTLAEAIYRMARYMNVNFLKGRTIGGINTELQLHYFAYILGIKKENAKIVDIGSAFRWQTGYDSNAWFFETANAAKILYKFLISPAWALVSIIRSISRYL